MASIEKRTDKPSETWMKEKKENCIESSSSKMEWWLVSVYSEKENAEIRMALTNQHVNRQVMTPTSKIKTT